WPQHDRASHRRAPRRTHQVPGRRAGPGSTRLDPVAAGRSATGSAKVGNGRQSLHPHFRLSDERVRLGEDRRRTRPGRGPHRGSERAGSRGHRIQYLLGAEKAQEKVFADLGRVKHLKQANPNLMIAVGGCVASQEGGAIVERAPFVDVVFGPQTLHRLPALLARRRASGEPQVDISFPEIEKFDHLPPARGGLENAGSSAFVSIMEGCSKYCSFCVVPYTRGEEVSRPFEDIVAEIASLKV